jgi:rubrerythrin
MNMPFRNLLKTAPPKAVKSLDELFAIASAMEHEAAERYGQLAGRMRQEGQTDLADLFERLAADEQGHEGSVLSWSQQRIHKAPDPADIRWELPETFDEETAAELASSRLINAYRVLSMAVRNEERAFTLWSYIAAQAEDEEIQQAAERMAHEELAHASLLRRARRAAYRAERAFRPEGGAKSIEELPAFAVALEKRLTGQLRQLAGTLTGDDASRIRELMTQTETMAQTAASLLSSTKHVIAAEGLDEAAVAERLVEAYLDLADRSRDEQVVLLAQSLARDAIARLAWLRLIISRPS